MYTDSADLARYARNTGSMMLAFITAALISVVFCGFIGVYAAKAMGDANWFVGATAVQPYVWMYLLLLVVLVADNWFINIMNLYTGGFAVVNVLPRIGRFWATVIVAIVGIALSGMKTIYDNTPAFVNEIGFAFAPVSGILLAHYVVLSAFRIDLPAIYKTNTGRYRYWHGINPVAIVVGILGYFVARSELIGAELIRPIVVVVLTGIVYAIAMKVVAQFWPPAKDAIDSSTMKDRYDPLEVNRELLVDDKV